MDRRERKAERDTPLIRALGLAHYWQALLDDGKYRSLTEIAIIEGVDRGQAGWISQLTRLAPDIVEACGTSGNNDPPMDHVNCRDIPTDWGKQRLTLLAPGD